MLELARLEVDRQEVALDRWIAAFKVFDWEELRELILLEQFKNSAPKNVEIYLSERNIVTTRTAAILRRGDGSTKPVVLLMSDVGPSSDIEEGSVPTKVPPPIYDAFTSHGTMSVTSEGEETSVTILRNTGAAQSLLLQGAMDLPDSTSKNRAALLEGVDEEVEAVPHWACNIAKKNLATANECMKQQYDRKAVPRSFNVGDQVLMLMLLGGEKLGTCFKGPNPILKKVGGCNYVVSMPDCRLKTRLCHINLLKQYVERTPGTPICYSAVAPPEVEGEEFVHSHPEPVSAKLQNTQTCDQLGEQLSYLTESQRRDIVQLVEVYPDLFKDTPRLGVERWRWVMRLPLNNILIGLRHIKEPWCRTR
ncbi:hypothetical protein SKAU_G00239380 [Synaphobranchus kaupii]|uniref:Uncharacterized protein n=1 Tax=Synaphobranchus kaupii TaxID=118154 RepID=A0A9Q1F763_SYNKA|nr:hypothetical protein SKAU_G00239380 [Synaphobranchus kaupii]